VGASGVAQGTSPDAGAVLAAAREALGGEQRLAAVKTFVATGRTRQVRGNNLVPIEFEILCELPDKYVRRDEIPAQESGPTSIGFNGEVLIQLPAPPEPPPQAVRPPGAPTPGTGTPPATATPPAGTLAGGVPAPSGRTAVAGAAAPESGALPAQGAARPVPAPPPGPNTVPPPGGQGETRPGAASAPAQAQQAPLDPRRARLLSIRQDFVRLTLGMFASSFSSYPLTFTLAGEAAAPQGRAQIVAVKGEGNFAPRLFIDSETHLPIMLSWTVPATNIVMKVAGAPAPENLAPGSVIVEAPPPPAAGAPKEEQEKYVKDVQDLRKKALAGARPVEYRVYYADYREVGNGLKFPFRLRRAIAGETVEETNFDGYRINARIDPRRFEVTR